MKESNNKQRRLSFGEKVSYGFGGSAQNVYAALVSTFLTAYYTDTVGLAAMAVGTMMLFARIFDGVTDLAMGMIVDKTKSKYGKARPWILWTAPFMMIGLVLMFSAPAGLSDNGKLIYAYLTYIFMNCIISTSSNLPFNALLARMTLDVQDRTSAFQCCRILLPKRVGKYITCSGWNCRLQLGRYLLLCMDFGRDHTESWPRMDTVV